MNRALSARLARIELVGRDRQWTALVAEGQTDGRCAVLSVIGNIAPQPPMITGAF